MRLGAAPSPLNDDGRTALVGTRILKPLRSAALLIGTVAVVISRNPLAHILSKACRFTLAKALITSLPRPPSSAFQACVESANANAMLVMPTKGTSGPMLVAAAV